MSEELRQFPEFSVGVLLGLLKASLTDVDVFLLVLAALVPFQGLRRSLWLYAVFRRADQYAGLFANVFKYPENPSGPQR